MHSHVHSTIVVCIHTSIGRCSCALKHFCIKPTVNWRGIIYSFDWIKEVCSSSNTLSLELLLQVLSASSLQKSYQVLCKSFKVSSSNIIAMAQGTFCLSLPKFFCHFFCYHPTVFVQQNVLPMNWEDTEENRKMFNELLSFFKSTWSEDCLDDETAKACGLTKYKRDLIARCQKMDKSWIKDATDRFFLCEYKGGPVSVWGDTSPLLTKVKARIAESKVMPIPKWPYSKFACSDRMCKGCKKRCRHCLLCEINKMQDIGRSQSAKNKKMHKSSFSVHEKPLHPPAGIPRKTTKDPVAHRLRFEQPQNPDGTRFFHPASFRFRPSRFHCRLRRTRIPRFFARFFCKPVYFCQQVGVVPGFREKNDCRWHEAILHLDHRFNP